MRGKGSVSDAEMKRVDDLFDKLDAFMTRIESVADTLIIKLEATEETHHG